MQDTAIIGQPDKRLAQPGLVKPDGVDAHPDRARGGVAIRPDQDEHGRQEKQPGELCAAETVAAQALHRAHAHGDGLLPRYPDPQVRRSSSHGTFLIASLLTLRNPDCTIASGFSTSESPMTSSNPSRRLSGAGGTPIADRGRSTIVDRT